MVENFGFRVTFSFALDYSVTLTTLCYTHIYIYILDLQTDWNTQIKATS